MIILALLKIKKKQCIKPLILNRLNYQVYLNKNIVANINVIPQANLTFYNYTVLLFEIFPDY